MVKKLSIAERSGTGMRSWVLRLWLIVAVGLLQLVAGCTSRESGGVADIASQGFYEPEMKVAEAQRAKSKYLAYIHRVTIELPVERVEAQYNRILNWCAGDEKFRCTLLNSGLSTDNFVHGQIKLRIVPKGVPEALSLAEKGGATTHKSTSVEDLGDAIVDSQKRLEMLRDYRARLEKLSEAADTDVEAQVKIASEMARVQSDLEFADGRRAKLLQRVEMDIVDISLVSYSQKSFVRPIGGALKNFSARLSEGISDTITAVAYLLPWLILLALVLYSLRKIWVRVRRH